MLIVKNRTKSLFRKLLAANAMDIFLCVFLSICSSLLNFVNPFFLKRILESITDPTRENMTRAYVYATLMYLLSLLRGQTDVHYLWAGRRTFIRVRSELMISVYDKALRRKDFSGIAKSDKKDEDEDDKKKDDKKKGDKKDDKKSKDKAKTEEKKPKVEADIGKIVQLMSVDADRIAQFTNWGFMFIT